MQVLVLDASSVEAIACLGAHFFYSDQVHFNASHYCFLVQLVSLVVSLHVCVLI